MQVSNAADGASSMAFEFESAKHDKVHDRVTLTNTLRRDRVCRYCYSRTGGMVRAGSSQRGACSPPHDIADLELLHDERSVVEGSEWEEGDDEDDGDLASADVGFGDDDPDNAGSPASEGGDEGLDALDADDLDLAGEEMDAQSDDGSAPEGDGYTRSYRAAGLVVDNVDALLHEV